MKWLFALILLVGLSHTGLAQTPFEKLKTHLSKANSDSTVLATIDSIFWYEAYTNPDSALNYVLKGLTLARKINDKRYERTFTTYTGFINIIAGNCPRATEILLTALKMSESAHDTAIMCRDLNGLGLVQGSQNDYGEAVKTYHKLIALVTNAAPRYKVFLSVAYSNLSSEYEALHNLDSALLFAQQSYQLNLLAKDTMHLCSDLSILGLIQQDMHNDKLALEYYDLSVDFCRRYNNNLTLSHDYSSIATIYQQQGSKDSVLHYMKMAYALAKGCRSMVLVLASSSQLTKYYEGVNKIDSAFKYQQISSAANDSLYSAQKVKQTQLLDLNEKMREQEMADAKIKEDKERWYDIQLVSIALFIISFFVVLVLLSKKNIKPGVIEVAGLVGLLFLFEFITLIIHPVIEEFTNRSPVFMLVILVVIASVLVPSHHYLIKWIKEKLAKKKVAEN